MKCTICGTELSSGDALCKNCGTRVSEMGAGFGSAEVNSTAQYGYGGQEGFNSNAVAYKHGVNQNALKLVLCLVVIFLSFGIYMFKQTFTHKVDCGDFTITLPYSCSKDSSMDSLIVDTDYGVDSGGYGNSKMSFTYIAYDLSDVSDSELTEDEITSFFITYVGSMFESEQEGYTKQSATDDTLKFTYTNDEGETMFALLTFQYNNDKVYMHVFMCNSSDKSKYEGKFEKYTKSINYNA